ncbi:hypothetical protein BKA82DRAFT_35883 [Pisolithus tinctorius]|uniref:Uncharacterized protein n=1 Tax=Pisolithus tinctorius Marx 270 TaxID=870435 RepID=A0A0C3I981_PISTI|nr:hypothetical protein BKA82DRAFT_35883 [Pisolithus tinctorius]KIN93667.1 hypothetical protein M404DRAFT_35883 [Pisolithus tinctorius Marx 270]
MPRFPFAGLHGCCGPLFPSGKLRCRECLTGIDVSITRQYDSNTSTELGECKPSKVPMPCRWVACIHYVRADATDHCKMGAIGASALGPLASLRLLFADHGRGFSMHGDHK